MLTVFFHQVFRSLRDKTLFVWMLGFPIVLSFIFMVQLSNLDEAYEVSPMGFGIVQGEVYRAAPDLDALMERTPANDTAPHLITRVAHSTASEAEATTKHGNTNGYLVVENGELMLYAIQKGDAQESPWVLRAVMGSYAQTQAEHEALIEAGTPPEQVASLQAGYDFTQPVSVTPVPVRPMTRYCFALLVFVNGMSTTVAMIAVQGIMATSPLGARQTMAGLPRWKVPTATLTASWAHVLVCLLIAFAFIATVAGVDFRPYLPLCLMVIGVVSLMPNAAGTALGTSGELGVGMVSAITCLLSLFTGLYGPGVQSLADSIECSTPLPAQASPPWQAPRCFYGPLYYGSPEPFTRSCAALLGMTCLFLTIALTRARKMNHEHFQDLAESGGGLSALHPDLSGGAVPAWPARRSDPGREFLQSG